MSRLRQYDQAGRKIAEIVETKETRYEYDDFDRVIKIERLGKKENQVELYAYDGLDRVIAKTLQDAQGKIYAKELYAYDIQGNQIQKTIYQDESKIAIYRACYGSDGKLLWKEDPLGNKTTWTYNHHHINGLGQTIQARIILDPLGRPTLETDDAFGRLARRDIYEDNKQVSCTHFFYDATGNLTKQHVIVMADGQPIRDYSIINTYNSRGLLESQTEMPHGKSIHYTYDSTGRIKQKQKPDGVSLHYLYDALGRLQLMTSTDGGIHYGYAYDLHDQPIQICDMIHNQVQKRAYDLLGRLVHEELSPGVLIHYTYDSLDRLVQAVMPDGSSIQYEYDAFYLKKVKRIDPFGQLGYECACPSYDLAGHILQEKSPAGAIDYTYDLLGRAIEINALNWQAHLQQFDAAGNLLALKQKDPSSEFSGQFTYDRFNHLAAESAVETNHYQYDNLGNCLKKNTSQKQINALNQLVSDEESTYEYDVNGNLTQQINPPISYQYDALNRLISCEKEGNKTTFVYDSFDRCLSINDDSGKKSLVYQEEQEIGSLSEGKLQELRLIHPKQEKIFAIELQGKPYFPIQDYRSNICALQKQDGTLAEWTRYSAFGKAHVYGQEELANPWRFANKREVADLLLFGHRFYNPKIMRWQTADPLGFEDGLNLYAYVHNNPFYYQDPDGQFAFVIPLLTGAFGVGSFVVSMATAEAVAGAAIGFTLGLAVYEVNKKYDHVYNQELVSIDEAPEKIQETKNEKTGRKRGKDNKIKGGPPRDPRTADYLPDPLAIGPHTTIGTRKGKHGPYTQGATFDEEGNFKGRTDVTDHDRRDHPNPHYHPATGPDSANSPAEAIPEFL